MSFKQPRPKSSYSFSAYGIAKNPDLVTRPCGCCSGPVILTRNAQRCLKTRVYHEDNPVCVTFKQRKLWKLPSAEQKEKIEEIKREIAEHGPPKKVEAVWRRGLKHF